MKSSFSKILVFTVVIATSLSASASKECLKSYSLDEIKIKNSKRKPLVTFTQSHESLISLSSQRKMNIKFVKGFNFNKQHKVKVILHGLGKSIEDFEYLFTEAKKRGDSILAIDLHGFGKTAKNNDSYSYLQTIPIEYSVHDVLEILSSIDPNIKIDLIGHSYGWGVVYETLKLAQHKGIELNIDTVVNNNGLDKNLDKFYMDTVFTGEYVDVFLEILNPNLSLVGIPDEWIQIRNSIIRQTANPVRNPLRVTRDYIYSYIPYFELTRNLLTAASTYWSNLLLAQSHIIANSSIGGIQKILNNPDELTKIILYNIAVIFGSRDVNTIDFSKDIELSKKIKYVFVSAANDIVVPSPISHNAVENFSSQGYHVTQFVLARDNHYSIYSPNVSEDYDILMGNKK
ncbi:MAG: alpha/beta hydrolase [Bdellovibrionaceae bacterium]|nr:alpha/beta hydrolase [Pseudobdellovibrionaceae bacterium]NUM60068.1 alpha/beta hydrolase [Pseudobdellovibrionaceae bacterium]